MCGGAIRADGSDPPLVMERCDFSGAGRATGLLQHRARCSCLLNNFRCTLSFVSNAVAWMLSVEGSEQRFIAQLPAPVSSELPHYIVVVSQTHSFFCSGKYLSGFVLSGLYQLWFFRQSGRNLSTV